VRQPLPAELPDSECRRCCQVEDLAGLLCAAAHAHCCASRSALAAGGLSARRVDCAGAAHHCAASTSTKSPNELAHARDDDECAGGGSTDCGGAEKSRQMRSDPIGRRPSPSPSQSGKSFQGEPFGAERVSCDQRTTPEEEQGRSLARISRSKMQRETESEPPRTAAHICFSRVLESSSPKVVLEPPDSRRGSGAARSETRFEKSSLTEIVHPCFSFSSSARRGPPLCRAAGSAG